VQAALSALPLFHELLGFRFRKLISRKDAKTQRFFERNHSGLCAFASLRETVFIFFVFIRTVRG
jgi:hypothetical protein